MTSLPLNTRWVARLAASVVFLGAGLLLFIWLTLPHLKEFSARSMKANTAVLLLLCAACLYLSTSHPVRWEARARRISQILGGFVLVFALGTLWEYVAGVNLGIDEWLVRDFPNAESSAYPGRMSPIATVSFIIFSAAILTRRSKTLNRFHFSTIMAGILFVISSVVIIGYLFDEQVFFRVGPYIRISWQTAACLNALAIGLLFSGEDETSTVLTSAGLGGMTVRRLLPVVVLVPVLSGWLCLEGGYFGLYELELGLAIHVVLQIAILIGIIIYTGIRLDSIDEEKNRTETAFAETRQQFETLANRIPQLAWMMDPRGQIYWYNQRFYDYTGTHLEQVRGWGWQDVHHPDHVQRVSAKFLSHIQAGEPWEDTFPLRSKEGEWRWFLSRAIPIKDANGKVIRWFGTNTDITEQLETEKRLEFAARQAKQASELKSSFLANMSHEIRTPLGAILGFSDLLCDPALTPEEKDSYRGIIARNGEQLQLLIDDILDLSKVEAGQLNLSIEPVVAQRIASEAESVLAAKAARKGLQLRCEVDANFPAVIGTDRSRLMQIILNLAGNAIKFTSSGTVTVRFSRGTDRQLHVEVSDTGVGISSLDQEKLFKPFSQADSSITRKYGGTGLGLALSKRLARMLGGDLILRSSSVGQGSIFELTITDQLDSLPTPTESPQRKDEQGLPLGDRTDTLKGIKVLIIDDSPDNRMLISKYLEIEGATTSEAANGGEGFEMAIHGDHDLVLMDLQMPVMDGYATTHKLREHGYRKPIIALSAHAMTEVRRSTLNVGCDDYMTKPLKAEELIAKVRYFAEPKGSLQTDQTH